MFRDGSFLIRLLTQSNESLETFRCLQGSSVHANTTIPPLWSVFQTDDDTKRKKPGFAVALEQHTASVLPLQIKIAFLTEQLPRRRKPIVTKKYKNTHNMLVAI